MWTGTIPNPVVVIFVVDVIGRRNLGRFVVVVVVVVVAAALLPLAYASVVGVPDTTNKPN